MSTYDYNQFFTDKEIDALPGENEDIKRKLQNLETPKEEGEGEDIKQDILHGTAKVKRLTILHLESILEKLPSINISDRNANMQQHLRIEDFRDIIEKLKREIEEEENIKVKQPEYAQQTDKGLLTIDTIDIQLLLEQSPISTLARLRGEQQKIEHMVNTDLGSFQRLYYILNSLNLAPSATYNNSYDYLQCYEQTLGEGEKSNIKQVEIFMRQSRINFINLFVHTDNSSALHEKSLEKIHNILVEIQDMKNTLLKIMDKTIAQSIATKEDAISGYYSLTNEQNFENGVTVVECQRLQFLAKTLGIEGVFLIDQQGKVIPKGDDIVKNYMSLQGLVQQRIERLIINEKRNILQKGEKVFKQG